MGDEIIFTNLGGPSNISCANEILLSILGWVTKMFWEMSLSPPAHPSNYFMTNT